MKVRIEDKVEKQPSIFTFFTALLSSHTLGLDPHTTLLVELVTHTDTSLQSPKIKVCVSTGSE